MNKRRRFKVKRRRNAVAKAWRHCRIMEAILSTYGIGRVRVTPTPHGIRSVWS